MRTRKHSHDSEIEDLLQPEKIIRKSSMDTEGGNSTTSAMNLDHLTKPKMSISPRDHRPNNYSRYRYGRHMSCGEYCCSYFSMLCYYHPKSCGCVIMSLLLSFMVFLASLLLNPTEEYGHIYHDHSNIQSKYDLSMGQVDHWCLGGGNDGCTCEDPLTPTSRAEHKSWIAAFKANRKLLKRFQDPGENQNLDVAFLGESIIEEIGGRWMGQMGRSNGMKNLEKIFQKHFHRAAGASVEGVALGIAGDTAPNVLWRLLHGEMPEWFSPKVWWISLGNNDLGRMECSEEIVVLGILRTVEEILDKRPNAHVVINSLFPMTSVRGGEYPVISDYKDSINGRGYFRSLAASAASTFETDGMIHDPPDGIGSRALRSSASKIMHFQTDDDMAEAAEKEEEARDKLSKRQYTVPTKRNPVMLEKTSVRKYRPETGFLRRSPKPLWTSIRAINSELRNFAQHQDRVTFFDATEIYTQKVGTSYVLLTERISIRGHPTPLGFSLWEDEIVKKLESIIEKMRRKQPLLFTSSVNEDASPEENDHDDAEDKKVTMGNDGESADDDMDDRIFHPNDDGFGNMGAARVNEPIYTVGNVEVDKGQDRLANGGDKPADDDGDGTDDPAEEDDDEAQYRAEKKADNLASREEEDGDDDDDLRKDDDDTRKGDDDAE